MDSLGTTALGLEHPGKIVTDVAHPRNLVCPVGGIRTVTWQKTTVHVTLMLKMIIKVLYLHLKVIDKIIIMKKKRFYGPVSQWSALVLHPDQGYMLWDGR